MRSWINMLELSREKLNTFHESRDGSVLLIATIIKARFSML